MTAASAARSVATLYLGGVHSEQFPMLADEVVFANALVCTDADGFLVDATDAAGVKCVGIAKADAANDAAEAEDGDVSATVLSQLTVAFAIASGSDLDESNYGDAVYLADNQTVGLEADTTNAVFVGTLEKIVSDQALVFIGNAPNYLAP